MGRLSPSRLGAVAVWSSAALAWGATAIAASPPADPVAGVPLAGPDSSVTTVTHEDAPIPAVPSSGLLIIRPAPPVEPTQPVRVVVVPAPSQDVVSVPAPAPEPRSSGS